MANKDKKGVERYVTQTEAARARGATFAAVNSWAHRRRIRTRESYGRLLVHLGDVLAYDPTANKGGRGRKTGR